MKRIGFILALVVFQLSCVTQRKITREEWQKLGNREYQNIDKETLIKNAEKVLVLSDPKDFTFAYTRDGFVGKRNWMVYAVLSVVAGTDNWGFEVKQEGNKLHATISPSRRVGSTTAYSSGGGVGAVTDPGAEAAIQDPATYLMFWDRLEYMLGLKDQWTDCNDGYEKVKRKETWGNMYMLCDMTSQSEYPDNLSSAEAERLMKDNYIQKWKYMRKHYPELWHEQLKKDPQLTRYN